jgi:ribosomal protein S1
MKKALAIVMSLMFVFVMTAASFAAEKAAEKKEAAPMEKVEKKAKKKVAHKQVTGEVAAVDAAANTVTVKGKKGEVTVSVTEKTKIMEGKAKKALADLKTGDKVTVKYTEAEGTNTAKSIAIKAAPVKKSEKKAEKKAEKKEAAPAKKEAAPAPAKKAAGY